MDGAQLNRWIPRTETCGMWLPDHMHFLPAVCRNCDLIFTTQGIGIEDSIGSSSGSMVGPCPRCGGLGDVLDGTFEARGAVLEFLDGPRWSRDALERLRVAAERASSVVEDNPELAAAFIQSAAPSLGRRVWQAVGSGQLANFIGIISILAGILIAQSGSESMTADEVQQIVETVLEQSQTIEDDSGTGAGSAEKRSDLE